MQQLKVAKIVNIRPIGTKKVVDVTVQKNHTFVTTNGIVVHNCNSIQPALRSFVEQYSKNCGFIFTCNYPNRLIAPLRSRFTMIDFNISKEGQPKIAAAFFKRAIAILKQENVEYDTATVAKVVERNFPDFRKTLGMLQNYSTQVGGIHAGTIIELQEDAIDNVFKLLKEKNFTEIRKWVAENSDQDMNDLFNQIYIASQHKVEARSMPGFVVALGEYMYKHHFVSNPEINMVAFLAEVMVEASFK